MLETLLIAIVVLAIVMAGMSIGVILSNKQLKGSCGGLNRVLGEDCSFCDKKDQCHLGEEH